MDNRESRLEVERPRGWVRDRLRRYRVWVDGRVQGTLRSGERRSFAVSPGHHALRVTIDWAGSPELEVDVGPGETARFECVPQGSLLAAPYRATVGRRQYLELRPATDPEAAVRRVGFRFRSVAEAVLLAAAGVAAVLVAAVLLGAVIS